MRRSATLLRGGRAPALSRRTAGVASASAPDLVPTIDIGPFRGGSLEERRAVAASVGKACREIGFFQVVNHGVDETTIDAAWSASKAFFDMPLAAKQSVQMAEDYPYGYSGMEEEVLSQTIEGAETAGDLKETFNICVGSQAPAADMIVPRWPAEAPAGYREAVTAYYRAMEGLSADLLRCFALALDLPEEYFEGCTDQHLCALRMLNYPHQTKPPRPGQLRASPHSDYGTLTLLRQDDAPGGLQVMHREKGWVAPAVTQGAFVVNLGDLMMRWTNDRWLSTLHQVVVPQPGEGEGTRPDGNRRQSFAFFHNLNPDALVECIPSCEDAGGVARYGPVMAGDYLMMKHKIATTIGAGARVEDHM